MQYRNSLLYSTIDSDLAKIEDDCDLTQKIVNSREKMRCTPLDPYIAGKLGASSFQQCMGRRGAELICSLEFTIFCVRSESGDFCFWQTAPVQPLIRSHK